jgi:hypothetical protein
MFFVLLPSAIQIPKPPPPHKNFYLTELKGLRTFLGCVTLSHFLLFQQKICWFLNSSVKIKHEGDESRGIQISSRVLHVIVAQSRGTGINKNPPGGCRRDFLLAFLSG